MSCLSSEETYVSPVVKWLVFFFNFIFWVAGGIMLSLGIWAFVEKNKFYHVEVRTIYDVIFDISIGFMVLGIVIFILGSSGCIGALRENTCLLKFFYVIMILIFIGEVTLGVLAFVFRDKAKSFVTEVFQENFIPRYEDDPDAKSFIDWIQENIYCCGVTSDGYRDWNDNMYFNCTEGNPSRLKCATPYSCCRKQDTIREGVPNIFCGADTLQPDIRNSRIYTTGCIDAILNMAEQNLPIVGGVVIAFTVPQLIGICLTRMLEGQILDQISRWQRRYRQT
ncbi:hypothetical protein LOTGIDRAFT_160862 [Lottia gigantea]|uniref:Tetraspanin n=1 Tax=Lottia gigantea TaxID=225164 RepID=V4ANB2_LOTGI|nr:hypothetical protein LOTGIDRAFT_160862 [Lottia gigantea]ESO95101.1 hypothetical protein LOTGIDRAFT_160862 [Lottia gigantea]